MNVEGKVAIVTGGATGIGRATALALARLGCSPVVNYSRSRDNAEATAADARTLGVRAIAFAADVADDAACRALVDATVRELGRLDILVQSAGTTVFVPHGDLDGLKDEHWARIFDVNVKGAFQCARAARGPMLTAGEGEIVHVASTAAIQAVGSSIPYCASKAALLNLNMALARVLAPKIRVNAVAPGFVTGRWLEQGLGKNYEAFKQAREKKAVLGRVADPDDIAQAIVSLITGSDLVTGQVIVCDGGALLAP
jgi:3-oxoacyl-[acyl-carrier protein] reductase